MPAADKRKLPAPAGNTATGYLKLVAFVSMLIDHVGLVFFSEVPELHILGRIAFPVYVWCVIVGFHYTRDVGRYLLRLFLLFAVSQPLYALALSGSLLKPNVCLTLCLGLGALWGVREKKYGSAFWAPAAAICLATLLHADSGWKGILLFLLLYAVQDSRRGIAAVMIAFFLFVGSTQSPTESLFGIPLQPDRLPAFLAKPLSAFLRNQVWALLSLPFLLILWPRQDVKMPKWLGYALYPGHLALIYLLRLLFL